MYTRPTGSNNQGRQEAISKLTVPECYSYEALLFKIAYQKLYHATVSLWSDFNGIRAPNMNGVLLGWRALCTYIEQHIETTVAQA